MDTHNETEARILIPFLLSITIQVMFIISEVANILVPFFLETTQFPGNRILIPKSTTWTNNWKVHQFMRRVSYCSGMVFISGIIPSTRQDLALSFGFPKTKGNSSWIMQSFLNFLTHNASSPIFLPSMIKQLQFENVYTLKPCWERGANISI